MQVLFLYGTRKSKPRIKSEPPRKQQYTVRLFDCKHLAHVIVLWQMQKFMCYCTVFALFNFEFEGNFQVQAPGGLYLEGRFKGGFFTLRGWGLIFGGAYTWRGLFSEFLRWRYGMSVAPCAILSNFFVANSALYSTANDPEIAKDPQNGPQTILVRKWSPKSTANDPERKIGMTWTQVSGSSYRFCYYYKKSD